jgi:hypothetical protein
MIDQMMILKATSLFDGHLINIISHVELLQTHVYGWGKSVP